MSTSADNNTASASAYTNAIANQRASLVDVAMALDPTVCEASGKALKGLVVVVTGTLPHVRSWNRLYERSWNRLYEGLRQD